MDSEEYREQLLLVAKQRLRQIPGAYQQFRWAVNNTVRFAAIDLVGPPMFFLTEVMGHENASARLAEHLQKEVDRWVSEKFAPVAIEPLVLPDSPGKEDAQKRRARRYQMCVDAGLKMPTNDYSHLPKGVGKLATAEGIKRTSFTEDIRAHIRFLYGK